MKVVPLRPKRPEIVVLKLGGAVLDDRRQTARVVDLVRETSKEARVVIVHGGGPQIGALHGALGVPFQKRGGLRVTPDESMPIVAMALLGLVNTRLVADLGAAGIEALGLSGLDLGLLDAPLLDRERFGRVGAEPSVRTVAVHQLLLRTADALVIAPICRGPDGQPVNVNADSVARALAASLPAKRLDLVTDVPGVRGRQGTIVEVTPEGAEPLIDAGVVRGGMAVKLREACAAVRGGVERVRIGDLATLTSGLGTAVCRRRSTVPPPSFASVEA